MYICSNVCELGSGTRGHGYLRAAWIDRCALWGPPRLHGKQQAYVLLHVHVVKFYARHLCYSEHSLTITADGAIWSRGFGGQGRLGHGDQQHQLLPKKIEAFAGRRVVAVSAGAAACELCERQPTLLDSATAGTL